MTAPATAAARGTSPMYAGVGGPTMLPLIALLPPQFMYTYKYFGSYPASFLTLAASSTQTTQVTIETFTDFIMTYAMLTTLSSDFATLQPFAPCLVQMTDGASQASLFQSPTHANNVYGSATDPGIFAMPYVIAASATFTIQHQNQIATALNQYIALTGFKSVVGSNINDPKYNPYLYSGARR